MSTGSHSKRMVLLAVVVALVGFGAACGGDDDDGGSDTLTAQNGEVTLVAKSSEWNAERIEAEPGELTITVDNQDDGISHNLHVKDGIDEKTKLEKGKVEQTLELDLEAGEYEFVCDVHVSTMKGTLAVAEATAGAGE